ncbi:MAG: archease [Candidatus Verstraetearchaeota archaeon]|nr:archease [Candidatus Verstraetearchaeota archaeon]
MYEYLDHTSDVYIHVCSESLEGLFAESAEAATEVMFNTRAVEMRRSIQVEMDAKDLEQLLYLWIDRLIYHFDSDSFALGRAEVEKVEVDGIARLSAILWGEEYDPAKHGQRTGIKAMTYSLMRIHHDGGAWHAYFVVDI